MKATQGHRYLHNGIAVLAMESGESVEVREIGPLWLGQGRTVPASELEPQPMTYFRGEVPRG